MRSVMQSSNIAPLAEEQLKRQSQTSLIKQEKIIYSKDIIYTNESIFTDFNLFDIRQSRFTKIGIYPFKKKSAIQIPVEHKRKT